MSRGITVDVSTHSMVISILSDCSCIPIGPLVVLTTALSRYIIQVNEKVYKLERIYRDCIKMTRDKTRIYSIPHDAPGA